MHTLFELQQLITQQLNHPQPQQPLPALYAPAPLDATERLAIYRRSSTAALLTALQDAYPVCTRIVGADFFRAMALHYIQHTPSRSPSLDDYGADLAAFIAQFPHAQTLPYLADVARLEWAWHNAARGADWQPLDGQALAHISSEDYEHLVFTLPDNSALLASPYPIHTLWMVNQPDYPDEPIVDIDTGGVALLVWRQTLTPRIDMVDEAVWPLLCALAQQQNMAQLCAQFTQQDDQFVAHTLATWVACGWVAGFHKVT